MNKKFIALSLVMFAGQFNATPTTQAVKATAEVAAKVAKKGSSKLATLFVITTGATAVGALGFVGYRASQVDFDIDKTKNLVVTDIQTAQTTIQQLIDTTKASATTQAQSTKESADKAIADAKAKFENFKNGNEGDKKN